MAGFSPIAAFEPDTAKAPLQPQNTSRERIFKLLAQLAKSMLRLVQMSAQ